jgi:hypothetical protein
MQSRADGASPFPRMMEQHRSRARSSWIPRLRACQPARMGATIPPHVLFYFGSLLSRDVQVERMSSSDSIKQRSQLRWRGRLRPRPPKAPEHYPRVQPSSHLPQSHRP